MSVSWRNRPLRELLRLSGPAVVSMISYSVMSLVDVLLAGRHGQAAIAGVGLGGVATFTFLCFQMGVLRGSKTLIAQSIGADRYQDVGPYTAVTLWFALGVGIFSVALGPLFARVLAWTASSAEAGDMAALYVRIRLLGAPLVLVYVALREVHYAQGDARSPMVATVVANGVNLGLALWFQRGLHWGVGGLAAATVVAHAVEAGVMWGVHLYRKSPFRGGTLWHFRQLLSMGLPIGLQSVLEVGAFTTISTILFSWGEIYSAAHQIAVNILHLSFLPSFAIAESAAVLAGQAVGANHDELVLPVAKRACLLTTLYAVLCTGILVGWAPALVSAFMPEKITNPHDIAWLRQMAIHLLHIAALFQVIDGANMVARCTLRGCGDVRFAAIVGIVISWICTPPVTWLFGRAMQEKAIGAWIGLSLEIFLGALLFWWRLWRKRWLKAAEESRRTRLLTVD